MSRAIAPSRLGARPRPPGRGKTGPVSAGYRCVVLYGLLTTGIAAVSTGDRASLPMWTAAGGGLLAAAGIAAAASLSAASARPIPAAAAACSRETG